MDFLYQFNDVDFCDSACGEVVIDSNETSDGEKMLCGIVQSTVCGQAIADDQNVELDDCDMDSNSLSGEGLKLGSISPAASNNMTKFHSVVHVQKHELLANFHTVQMDEENTGTGVQQRVIIVAAGNDPQREMNLAIEKITAELDRKASEAMTNGIKPEPETVIEITTVMESSEQHSMQQQKAHTRMLGLGRENIPPAAGTVFVQTNRNLPISREPSVLTVHNKDYKTPSPLVPAWDRRQAVVIDKSCDTDLSCDLYYQPSSAVDNAAASNESMVDGNFVVQGFEAIPVEIEANCVDVANASHASSSTNVVVDRNKSAKIFSQRLEGPRWHPVELVACEEQIDTNMCRRGSPLRRSTSVQQACSSSKVESRRKRPPYSYMQLIQMAIRSTPEMRMTLREIYQWIENQFPYYRHMPSQGWKNSIRHNLSLYDIFVRKKATTGKACVSYWMMRKLDDSDSSFNTTKDMQDLDLSADADVNTGRKRINPPVTSSNERRHCEGTSQRTQRRGLIPLLPKPSPSMSTITVLQLPTNGTGVTSSGDSRRLGASVESTQSSSVSSGWSSQFPTGKLNQALTHSVGPKAMFKRISSATAAEISSTHPVKIKRMCRSASVVENSVSQNLFNVGCQPVSLDPVANVSTFSENQDSELGSSLDTSSLRQQFSDLHFEFSAGDGQKMPVPVRSASDLILSRNISCIVVDSSSAKNVAEIESSKLQATGRTGRRKQTFSNLLRTPPDKMSLKRESKDITPYVDTLNHLEMESGYATMLESGVVISRPETPTHQLIPHSPMHGSAVDEEDVAQMLFTPFKADFNVLALTDLSPVLDMSSSVGAVDSWAGFTPVASEKSSARTSTPCRLLNSTPKISSQDNCRQKYELSPRFYRLLSEFNDEELTGVSQIAADDLDQSGNSNSILDNCIYTENSCINLLID